MTVCEMCMHLCNGLGPLCDDCQEEVEKLRKEMEADEEWSSLLEQE